MIYKVKDGFLVRRIGGQMMAVPVGQRTSEFHGIIALTESGALLWQALTEGAEPEALTQILLDTYEVTEERARQDVEAFLRGLRVQGALE
ncbi:MAG: PqqD family protein [Oscillospiraceae bacterium]|nr:PqqD family protein [Oscillospiraceae bacterium]